METEWLKSRCQSHRGQTPAALFALNDPLLHAQPRCNQGTAHSKASLRNLGPGTELLFVTGHSISTCVLNPAPVCEHGPEARVMAVPAELCKTSGGDVMVAHGVGLG